MSELLSSAEILGKGRMRTENVGMIGLGIFFQIVSPLLPSIFPCNCCPAFSNPGFGIKKTHVGETFDGLDCGRHDEDRRQYLQSQPLRNTIVTVALTNDMYTFYIGIFNRGQVMISQGGGWKSKSSLGFPASLSSIRVETAMTGK